MTTRGKEPTTTGNAMRRAISLLTLTVFVFAWTPSFADTLTGKVVKVADGDTITVLAG